MLLMASETRSTTCGQNGDSCTVGVAERVVCKTPPFLSQRWRFLCHANGYTKCEDSEQEKALFSKWVLAQELKFILYYYIIISCIFSHLSKSKSYIKKKHNIKSEIKLEKNSSNNIFQTLRSSPFYKTRPVKLFGKN